jgi:hypothetical protein
MADTTIAEEIAELETRLAALNTKIDEQESFRELEEGGQGARFRTQFADIGKLYKERDHVRIRLRTLRMGA